MKVGIDQAVLVNLLERGAMAALSDEAQGDTSNFAVLVKSVKITVNGDFIVESATNLIATKAQVPATEENGITVKEKGSVLVAAKELYNWVLKQNKAKIVLSLSLFATPKIISTAEDIEEADSTQYSVTQIGELNLASRDDTKTGNKWKLDGYDPDQISVVDFDEKHETLFHVPTTQLTDALNGTLFSSQTKDYQHIYDSVNIEKYNGHLYMAATDTHRCSIYKMDKAESINDDFFTESTSTKNGGKFELGSKVLIPCAYLKLISKYADESQFLNFYYDKDKNKVYVHQKGWDIRLATVDSNLFQKFPTIYMLLEKKYSKLGYIPKGVLANRLTSASLVNKSTVLFDFSKDSVIIHAISEGGHAPNVSNAPVRNLTMDVKAIWGVQHVMDVIKVVKDADLCVMVPDDLRSMKVTSEEDQNLSYYAMTIDNVKYASLMND